MENHVKENQDDAIKDEDFADEFQCCVCLDLLYKPVILACGHMACFWCIYQSMSVFRESHCPVCRQSYNHFPRTCRLLHFLLQKLYPSAYGRRQKQVSEEEEESGNVSEQFDNSSSLQHGSNMVSTSFAPYSDSAGGEPSSDSSQTSGTEDIKATTTSASSGTAAGASMRLDSQTKAELGVNDLTCAICHQLLYQPVVLNCGDVYCEACIINSSDNACKCPVCQSPHPNGFPNICLILAHFLEDQFPEEYAARKESSLKDANCRGRPSISSVQNDKQSAPTNGYPSRRSGQGPKVHIGVGCDYCGMCPIIGERHRCKDCKEKMGFDLCQGCYSSSCKLPGRFNQQHTEDHQFEIVEPFYLVDPVIVRIGGVTIEEHSFNPNLFLMPGGPYSEAIRFNDMQEATQSQNSDATNDGEDEGDSAATPIIIVDSSEDEDFGEVL